MIDRIKQVIEYSQLSSSAFADTIGISRSGLTHLLTGRNQPSLDVARKILAKFPEISTEWLIMGMGDMLRLDEQTVISSDTVVTQVSPVSYPSENLKSDRQINLFGEFENQANSERDGSPSLATNDVEERDEVAAASTPLVADVLTEVNTVQPDVRKSPETRQSTAVKRDRRQLNSVSVRKLQKIVFFYDDHSFEVFSN